MKKIIIFMTPILIMVLIAFGCSKDHEAPTFSTYKATSAPEDVEAMYDGQEDVVNVTWTMQDTSGVVDYLVAVSDSNVFDYGNIKEIFINMKEEDLPNQPYSYAYDAAKYVSADVDSTILYFTVSALYSNETFKGFIGPRAEVDSALVKKE